MVRSFILLCALALAACSPQAFLKKELTRIESELQEHAGFALYDPQKQKFLLQHRADRYYTPASNTKIFTLYTAHRLLGDSVPAIKYTEQSDSLFFWGMGDPSFLYRYSFQNEKTFNFLKNYPGTLVFSSANFHTERFGEGWAWDDYKYAYSPERSSFPIYGNLVTIKRDSLSQLRVHPPAFGDAVEVVPSLTGEHGPDRLPYGNAILLRQAHERPADWDVPFHYSDSLLVKLLADTLKRPVLLARLRMNGSAQIMRSVPADSLYKVMMQESDNFIAEQLLLQCAAVLSDSLRPEIAIRYAKKNLLNDLPDEPRWVDGSGLSRYNLFTPRSVVVLWEKLRKEIPEQRLYALLATGGKAGTIQNYFKADTPYLFGKTGTLSNNHCLSGYLITKKGRTLVFSFMHNNFVQPTRVVRQQMQSFLNNVHEKY